MKTPSNEAIIFDIDAMTLSEPDERFIVRGINNDFVQELKKSLTVCLAYLQDV